MFYVGAMSSPSRLRISVPSGSWGRLRAGFGQVQARQGDALEDDLLAPDAVNGADVLDLPPIRGKDDVRRRGPRANRIDVRAQSTWISPV